MGWLWGVSKSAEDEVGLTFLSQLKKRQLQIMEDLGLSGLSQEHDTFEQKSQSPLR